MHRFALFVALPATALSTGVRKQIYVDAAVPGGAISMATGVDKGPFCTDAPVNLTTELREVGTTFIRTHDAGTIDWSVNFPFPALDADTENPANYVWAAGDATMAAILDNGFVPYLRLGNSWTHPPWSAAPANLTALSRVLLNTVRHYNDGWGGGGFSSRQVRWIELWNEPDGGPGPNQFWNLSSSAFYELMDSTARLLKSYDPSLIVGTPATASPTSPSGAPYSWGLMEFIAAHNTPIDFYSWHNYGDPRSLQPYDYAYIGNLVRTKLDSLNLRHVFQTLTEWNVCIECPLQDEPVGAAFVASALTYQAAAGLVLSIYYPGCDNGWGLFDAAPLALRATPRPLTYALQFFNDLVTSTPAQLEAVTSPAELNYTVLAGFTLPASTGAASLGLLISALGTVTEGFNLTIASLSPLSRWQLVERLIDVGHNGTTVANETVVVPLSGSLQLSGVRQAPFVVYLSLQQLQV